MQLLDALLFIPLEGFGLHWAPTLYIISIVILLTIMLAGWLHALYLTVLLWRQRRRRWPMATPFDGASARWRRRSTALPPDGDAVRRRFRQMATPFDDAEARRRFENYRRRYYDR